MKTTIMIAFVNKTMSFFKSLFTSVILFLFGKEGHHEHNKIEDSMCVSGAGEIKLKFKSKPEVIHLEFSDDCHNSCTSDEDTVDYLTSYVNKEYQVFIFWNVAGIRKIKYTILLHNHK